MPFDSEFFYFYHYYKSKIEEVNNLTCLRADEEYQTKTFNEKIKNFINKADVIIADCTNKNANVYYEIGLAHSQNKDVIIISQDELKSNIQHYEYIRYNLDNSEEFIIKLNKAIQNLFIYDYDLYYDNAINLIDKFKEDESIEIECVTKEDFIEILKTERKIKKLPKRNSEQIKERLMSIVMAKKNISILSKMPQWLSEKAGDFKLTWDVEPT